MSKAWYIGNTTIRNPKRLKDGLKALSLSPLHGNLVGKDNELEFAKLLDTEEVVRVERLHEEPPRDASDVGRKWRAALMQLGFLKPSFAERPFTITQNGLRLISANSLPAEQECFLRALLAHQIPSQIESFPEPVFSPLRIVLEVISGLGESGLDPWISMDEMASIVQLIRKTDDVSHAISQIADHRNKLSSFTTPRERRAFINETRESAASYLVSQQSATLKDYADTNFRYLKLTGLFIESGRKLIIAEHKKTIVEQIISEPYLPIDEENYLETLWNGAVLPTDNASQAIRAIESTVELLERNGNTVTIPNLVNLEVADLSHLRLQLEEDWLKVLEMQYAKRQPEEWDEILAYLRALTQPVRGGGIIPQGEGPAYFEWALWRAFLAINNLENKPWEARRFRIDQEFLPVGTAPGGGPDMIFEFDSFVVVAEVTLTTSSRQEAAEGEPVRRHVAQLVDHYAQQGKRVYGLFLANKVDTNTAETYRIGVWYRPDDSKMALDIVPMTLNQFADLFEAGFSGNKKMDYRVVEQVIRNCLVESRSEAPEWKRRIDEQIKAVVQRLQMS
ncbi:AlwI family type II restriction endonuclease [Brevibacillus panacihumi]|uniref:AlwI family type II restriction endonuclease n=1 Tax=Brevibacillus panacihumi TaxID=497735 RepID=UPI003D04E309